MAIITVPPFPVPLKAERHDAKNNAPVPTLRTATRTLTASPLPKGDVAETNPTILAVPPQPTQTANDEIIERFVAYLGTEKGLALRARLLRGRFEGHCNRIITYLTNQQSKAETLDEQDHYNFCRRVVSLALEGWPDLRSLLLALLYGIPPIFAIRNGTFHAATI